MIYDFYGILRLSSLQRVPTLKVHPSQKLYMSLAESLGDHTRGGVLESKPAFGIYIPYTVHIYMYFACQCHDEILFPLLAWRITPALNKASTGVVGTAPGIITIA